MVRVVQDIHYEPDCQHSNRGHHTLPVLLPQSLQFQLYIYMDVKIKVGQITPTNFFLGQEDFVLIIRKSKITGSYLSFSERSKLTH